MSKDKYTQPEFSLSLLHPRNWGIWLGFGLLADILFNKVKHLGGFYTNLRDIWTDIIMLRWCNPRAAQTKLAPQKLWQN